MAESYAAVLNFFREHIPFNRYLGMEIASPVDARDMLALKGGDMVKF